jgi:uncharacterized protein (DUF362 family)/Pyruvate/2-oxoacid:ferredoxin oxidoreductase delta subunit
MEDSFRISIHRCARYDRRSIKRAIGQSLDIIGGIRDILPDAGSICIKPNLLLAAPPEQAITTHPVFVEAVVELVSEITGRPRDIVIADSFSPAVPYTEKGLRRMYAESGLADMAERTGCRLNYSTEYSTVSNPEGMFLKKIEVIKPILESDIIINLPKFKTHNLTGITGAVKNMFGAVPGFTKVGYHLRYEKLADFAGMLIDLCSLVKPALNIMDGILGMEGDGPGRSGTPRQIGLILVSQDALVMDKVMGRIAGLDEDLNPFMEALKENGVSGYDWDKIKIMGEKLEDVILDDFILPRTAGQKRLVENRFASKYIVPFVRNALNPYPYADPPGCDGCLTCQQVCPVKAVNYDGKKVDIDRSKCIRCFCCAEMCPRGAIEPRYSFAADMILNRLGFGGKKK